MAETLAYVLLGKDYAKGSVVEKKIKAVKDFLDSILIFTKSPPFFKKGRSFYFKVFLTNRPIEDMWFSSTISQRDAFLSLFTF